MSGVLLGTLAAAGLSAGAAVWNNWRNNKNIDKQLKAQADENAKARAYNLELARRQNLWNLQQWRRENEYNTPSAQRARLEAAGLNPNMMYGGVAGNTAGTSPMMTSGAPATPTDWTALGSKRSVLDGAVETALSNKLVQAQIDNINADTKKKGEETSILSSDASFRDAWNEGLLKTQNVEISVKQSQTSLNQQQILQSQKYIQQMDSAISQANAQIERWQQQTENEKSDLNIKKKVSTAQIKEMAAGAELKEQQAFSIAQQLEPLIEQIQSATLKNNAETSHFDALTIKVNNEHLKQHEEILQLQYTNGILKVKNEFATGEHEIKSLSDITTFITKYFMAVFR